MSAINVVCQRLHRCLHVVTDAAAYDEQGIVQALGTKVMTVPNWPGVVSSRGTSIALPLLAWKLSQEFSTFDDLVLGISEALPLIVDRFNLDMECQLVIAGWSKVRDAPESYVVETSDNLPAGMTQDERNSGKVAGVSGPIFDAGAYDLMTLPDVVVGPVVRDETIIAAHFEGIDAAGDDPGRAIAGLRKIIEMQRHDGHDGLHWVGGFAQLTTVTADGIISQRILHRWAEDAVGKKIQPIPIDWSAFNARAAIDAAAKVNNPETAAIKSLPAGLSRLQRQRMEKKARKGTLK